MLILVPILVLVLMIPRFILLKEDMAKKIAKNKERLAITQSKDETKKYEQRSDIEKKISKIKAEIEENQKQVESYGLQGEIEKAAEITTIVERLVEEKKGLEKRIEAMLAPTDEMGNKQKQMEVMPKLEWRSIFKTLDELKKKYGDILYSDRNDRKERRDRDYDRRRNDRKDYDRRSRDYNKDYHKRHDRGYGREREDVVVQEATHVTNK
uniref:Ribonuclease n=1 Tax=Strongyloides stercoralis TaxID=6248 RepID=A0A0K0E1F0_STRER